MQSQINLIPWTKHTYYGQNNYLVFQLHQKILRKATLDHEEVGSTKDTADKHIKFLEHRHAITPITKRLLTLDCKLELHTNKKHK